MKVFSASLISCLLFACICSGASAQMKNPLNRKDESKKFSIIAAGGPGITLGGSGYTAGADLSLHYPIFKRLDLFVAAGLSRLLSDDPYQVYIQNFVNQNSISSEESSGFKAVSSFKGGVRFTPWRLYISGEAGVATGRLNQVNRSVTTFAASSTSTMTSLVPTIRTTTFLFAPSVGFCMTNGIEAGLRFEGTSDWVMPDQFAIRMGYRF